MKINFYTKFKSLIALCLMLCSLSAEAQWVQVGQDIDGEAASDLSGESVSLSADGQRVAIGAIANDGSGDRAGHVRVYELQGGDWVQLGQDIDGEAAGDESGESVSLSAGGERLAIGAPLNDGNGTNAGHVRVYEYDGNNWVQLGADIDGETARDQSGISVSLSADGQRLAIGAPGEYANNDRRGYVRIYEYDGSNWVQLGFDINGEDNGDWSGSSISFSADGQCVAVGAHLNEGNGGEGGHARVYEYNGQNWIQLGSDINGENIGDGSGFSVSLSANGQRIAVGAFLNDGNGRDTGHTRVYEYDGSNWVQLGLDIDGEAHGDWSGYSISLSADGQQVAIGALYNDENGVDAGHVRIYEYQIDVWMQIGNDIYGKTTGDWLGFSVSSSADGQRVAIGAPLANSSGQVSIYEFPASYSTIIGKTYADANRDCSLNATEEGLRGWKVVAQPSNRYAYTNAQGEYTLYLPDTGTYTLSQEPPATSSYQLASQNCPTEPYTLTFEGLGNELTGYDFANEIVECAILSVDVTANRRRRCFESLTTVSYANSGVGSAENVEIQVVFPEYVLPKSSSVPWTSVQDSLYTFTIPSLAPSERGRIIITDSVACVETSRGLTQCTRATISPKNSCVEPPAAWSRASLEVEGQCLVIFDPIALLTLKNTGTGDMVEATNYRIYSDNEIIWQDQIQLAAGDSLLLEVPTQGRSIRLEAEQVPFHPDNRQVSVSVEGCGTAEDTISTGFVNQLPQNDDNLETEIDCQPVVDSYDPNDKLVSPLGVTENHYVQPGSTLEYKVRFQNTGTAEAINIEILDTLSEHLEMSTFQMMSASHDYALDILGDSLNPVLRWVFNDINLPDSTSNEPESHGYVKFKIAPKAETPEGTIVANFADIYFDFNEPIRTNTTISNFTDYQFPQNPIDPCRLVSQAEATGDQSLCESQNTAQIQASLPQSGQGQWQIIQGQGELENPFSAQTNIANLAPGENILRWSVSTDLCAENYQEITLTLHPQPQRPIIQALAGNQLQASVPGDAYEWYLDGSLMSENSQTIEPNQEGDYQVKVIQNDCPSELSEVFSFRVTSLEPWQELGLSIYPNPSQGALQIESKRPSQGAIQIRIYNYQGALVWQVEIQGNTQAQVLNLPELPQGLYQIQVQTEKGRAVQKLVLE